MAKQFSCKDMGMSCNFSARGKDEAELMKKVQAHARSAHPDLSIDNAMVAKIRSVIKEV
jgi:predicted small metal-binding protein